MNLNLAYYLYVGFVHLALGAMAFFLLSEHFLWFMLVEIGLLCSFVLAALLHRRITRPARLLSNGIDAIRDQDFAIRLRPTGAPDVDRLVKVYNHMMDNIRQERSQVQEQHYFLERLIQASPAGIILLDYDGQITEANPAAQAMLGLKPGQYSRDLIESSHPLLQQLASWAPGQSGILYGRGQEQFRCEVSHFVHRGFSRRFIMVQELSREILAAEKRAYGKVIRMMAHEVNNSIGAINSILETALEVFPDGEDAELAREVRSSLAIARQRNARLNQFMRNFAEVVRLPEPIFHTVDLHQLLQQVASLMEAAAKKQATALEIAPPVKMPPVEADERQLEQALVNMIKNALESLGHGGRVVLRAQATPLQVVVADNGPGLPQELQAGWATPFFSTKPDGQGIGLTLVREIARQHGGQCQLETLDNGWTECRIVLG